MTVAVGGPPEGAASSEGTRPPSTWLRRRRWVDRVLAAVALTASAPLIATMVALVRRGDGGPGLITVERMGPGRKVFRMWKIRTMRPSAAGSLAGGPTLTATDDDRITPIGRRIRGLHLDELTQLANVVKGEMLLLGPRPEAPEWVDPDDAGWDVVLGAPPGIAGPTQLIVADWERTLIDRSPDGRAYRDVVIPVKQQIDSWYLRTASPRLDALIVGSLVGHVVLGRRPRRLERLVETAVPAAGAPLRWADEHL
ncbi:MAG: sugar transferase [Microthrixaceae bacterium]